MQNIFIFFIVCNLNAQIEFKKVNGLPVVRLEINDKEGLFLIDTGAAYSLLDMNIRRKYKFRIWKGNDKARGVGGGVVKIYRTNVKAIKSKYGYLKVNFRSVDLGIIKSRYGVIGVLGSDFFIWNNMVIDFKKMQIIL